MNSYLENDYGKIEKQVQEHRELIITRHFSERMLERAITFYDLKRSLATPRVIRHEGSYDHYGNLRIKYTLQTRDNQQDDLAIIFALSSSITVILITVMYFWEEIGWERQETGLYLKR